MKDTVPTTEQAIRVARDAYRRPATLLEKSGCQRFSHAPVRVG